MYIKYHGFKCECGEIVAPDFYELHFDMREGEILENGSGELICEKCGAIYELEDMEFTPIFVRTDKKDENGKTYERKRLYIKKWYKNGTKTGFLIMKLMLV